MGQVQVRSGLVAALLALALVGCGADTPAPGLVDQRPAPAATDAERDDDERGSTRQDEGDEGDDEEGDEGEGSEGEGADGGNSNDEDDR